jgi:hypothetical protein
MHERGMRVVAVMALCAGVGAGCAGTTPPARAPAAPAAPWVYELRVPGAGDDASAVSATAAPRRLELREVARHEVAGHRVVELAASVDGEALTADHLGALAPAPFPTFAPRLALVRGDAGIWLLFVSDERGASEASVTEVLRDPPTWPLAGAASSPGGGSDEPIVYRKQVGPWNSVCNGLMHPAPESGDFFSWERCFEPSVGITRLVFHSVWGAYEAQLVQAPAGFALP